MRISDWSSDVCSSDLGVFAAALRWASDLDRNAVTFVALSGVFPRTSMRPPCLRKAVRSAAMVSLVRLRPTSLALLGRADRCEVLLDLRGMESPCRWFTVAALALANGDRKSTRLNSSH